MRSRFVTLLHIVGLVIGNALGDLEVKAFLEAKGLSLGPLSEGMGLSMRVRDAAVARETAMGRLKTLALALKTFFASIREEVSNLRQTLKTALRKREDLLLKVGIPVRHRQKKAAQHDPVASDTKHAATEASATPMASGAAGGGTEPNTTDGEKPKRKGLRLNRIDNLLAVGRTLIQGALDDPEILPAIKMYGYTKETLDGFLGQLSDLEKKQLDQKAAKGMKQAATKDLQEAGAALRDWFTPWKKRISTALKGQPDLRVRLGLPSNARKRAAKEADAKVDAEGGSTTKPSSVRTGHEVHPPHHHGHVAEPAKEPVAAPAPTAAVSPAPPVAAASKPPAAVVPEPPAVTPPTATPPAHDTTTK